MANFAFGELIPVSGDVISAALGTASAATGGSYSSNDVGRAVKLSVNQNYIDCASGDEIDGFITSVEATGTVNGGYSFGGVMVEGRKTVTVGVGTVAIGAYVVAGVQPAVVLPAVGGTANLHNGAATQAVVISGSPAHQFWRCIGNVTSPGTSPATSGQLILIEKV
jgi:hypothetical protein